MNSSLSASSSRSRSFLPGQLQGLLGQRLLGPDLGSDIPEGAEGADDLAVLVAERHLGGRYPGIRSAAVGLQLHLPDHRLAGLDDPLLIGEGGRGMLGAEDIEVGFAGQFLRRPARRVRGDPAGADEQEPAHPVLEVHPFVGAGQQVAHAGPPELADLLAFLLPRQGQPGLGHSPSPDRPSLIAPGAGLAASTQAAPSLPLKIRYLRSSSGLNRLQAGPAGARRWTARPGPAATCGDSRRGRFGN